MKAVALIPTYNEASNIIVLLNRLKRAVPELDVLVIDDGSPDGTADLVDEQNDPKYQVLRRTHKQGLGPAYIAGFGWALERGFDFLIEMDADGSHQPEQLPLLLSAAKEADLVIGSRWVRGGRVVNWPWVRQLISRAGNLYVRVLLGMRIHDATAGFRVYRAETLRKLNLPDVNSSGYCFQIELTYRAWKRQMRIVEVPITFIERERGQSKMSRTIVIEALWRTTIWGLRRILPAKNR